jgi:pimeloyl-ACP methyl ester carboxylesterase
MPLLILVFLLADIMSIAFIFIDYYLWHEWYQNRNTIADDYANRCLYGAIALLLLMSMGRFVIKALLSKRRKGEDEPQKFDTKKCDSLKRPEGSLINIEYYGKDDGQPIIFVHGWNANIKEWYYQRKHFENNYRLIMLDLPGLGKSTRAGNKDFSLTKMAADLNAVIEHTGAKNPVLWGHSIGGMTILTLVGKNKNPNRPTIKGIILEHTTYTNPVRTIIFSKLMTAIQKPILVPLCWVLIILSPIIWLFRWMSYLNGNSHIMTRFLTFTGTQTPKQLDFITLLSTMAPPAVTARGVLGMFKYDVTKDLSTINIPTLVIAANKDRLTKPEASEFMNQHIPNAQIVTISPGGHQGLIERHQEVNEAAERFMETLHHPKRPTSEKPHGEIAARKLA